MSCGACSLAKSSSATDWVNEVVQRGNFATNAVWRVISQIKANQERDGVEHVSGRGYRLATRESADVEQSITPNQIRMVAQKILDEQPEGEFIKLAHWIAQVMLRLEVEVPAAELSRKQVHAVIYQHFIAEQGAVARNVERGERGMYRKASATQDESGNGSANDDEGDDGSGEDSKQKEKRYYKPFAAYLRDTLLECDGAKDVSGIRFGTRSENPDVIGLAVSDEDDIVRRTELVSVEVKAPSNVGELMRGFEQACAYTRFSHKVYYVVVPESTRWWFDNHEARLTDLCHGLGIGLVVTDPDMDLDSSQFPFTLMTRARQGVPVVSELNRYLKKLREEGENAGNRRLHEFGFREDEEE